MFTPALTRKCLGLARIVAGCHRYTAPKHEARANSKRTSCYIVQWSFSVNGTRLPNLLRRNLFYCRRKSFSLARSSLNSFRMVLINGAAERRKLAAMPMSETALTASTSSQSWYTTLRQQLYRECDSTQCEKRTDCSLDIRKSGSRVR